MAKLLSIRQKEKEYVFKVFDNEKSESPAKAVFKRFPLEDETFPYAPAKSIFESSFVKDFDNSPVAKEQLVQGIIDVLIQNLAASRVDYTAFLKECVSGFKNLEYEGKEIKTIDDFLALPEEAVYKISKDLYKYSKIEDKFSIEEKKLKDGVPSSLHGV
jgi:hypothetical protein